MTEKKTWTAQSTNDWNETIAEEFRANGGKVGGRFDGADLLILHTAGARSGEPRMTPLMYLPDGDRYILFATYAGNPRNPAWFYNLQAGHPIRVEVGSPNGEIETVAVQATVLSGAERDRLWARQIELFPPFGRYEETAGRVIPVVALSPQTD
jgi:deazaflavin-dependent oxidoreductase (nitroreductase family)